MDLKRWEYVCQQHGLQPVGRSSLPMADVYVAERRLSGNVLSADPIECQTHYEIAWALDKQGGMAYGRTIKVKAMDVLNTNDRIKMALKDAADHIAMGAKVSARYQ